jgi:hypothetical protein
MEDIILEAIIHGITFLAILVPLYYSFKIYNKNKDGLLSALRWLFLSMVPAAIYHLLESLEVLGLYTILPPEGSMSHIILDHATFILVFVGFGIFLRFFKKSFLDPIYAK